MTQRRPLALGAAAVLGFGSLFIAAPAMAEETPTVDTTASAMAAVTEINEKVAESPAVGAGTTTDGQPIVMVEEVSAENTEQIEALAAEHGVQNVAIVGNVSADASTDIVAGAGYFGVLAGEENSGGSCSVGFTGFSPDGDPAVITAGHCSSDGAISEVSFTAPSNDAAGGDTVELDGNGLAGTFGFSQFGGVGNTPGAENDPNSTDIAVIDITNDALNLLPEVTDWKTAAQDDLSLSTTPIKSVGLPQAGTLSKSGRTTGLSTGDTTVNLKYTDGSIRATEILDGYMQVSNRWVHGFIGGATTSPGDSGGAVFQGETAVGVVSGGPDEVPAGTDDYAWYTLLQPALGFTDGYTVALDIDEPVVKTDVSEGVPSGSDIVVTVPSNAKELSVGQGQSGESIPVEGAEVSFTAPDAPGNYSYTLVAQNGFSQSEPVEVNFEVVLAAPTVADVDTTENDVTLTGTGIPGADVTVELDGASYTATVGEDRNWSVEVADLAIGEYTVTASQTFEGDTSADATGNVIVRPTAVGDLSIAGGSSFAAADAPTEISGSGIEGAAINLSLNGTLLTADAVAAQATVVDGAWTVDFGGQVPTGTHTVDVSQTVNGVTSVVTTIVFTVEAAPVPPVAPVDPGTPGAPADPANPAAPGGQGGTGGAELVNTGTGFSMLPFGLAALGMLVLGGGAIVFTQRRLQATAAE